MTIKQAKAIKIAGENGGKISTAMIEAGYAPATAHNPDKLTNTKVWQQLMEQYLPDNKLLEVGSEGLDSWKVHTSHTEPDREVPDFIARAKYLELAFKLKKRLGPDVMTQVNVGEVNVTWKDGKQL